MIQKISIWLSKFGALAKTIAVIITLSVSAFGIIKGYNKLIINAHEKDVRDILREHDIKTVIVKLDSLSCQVGKIRAEQIELAGKVENINGTVGTMRNQIGIHMINTATKQDIRTWFDAFEKKNVISMYPIVPKQDRLLTQ